MNKKEQRFHLDEGEAMVSDCQLRDNDKTIMQSSRPAEYLDIGIIDVLSPNHNYLENIYPKNNSINIINVAGFSEKIENINDEKTFYDIDWGSNITFKNVKCDGIRLRQIDKNNELENLKLSSVDLRELIIISGHNAEPDGFLFKNIYIDDSNIDRMLIDKCTLNMVIVKNTTINNLNINDVKFINTIFDNVTINFFYNNPFDAFAYARDYLTNRQDLSGLTIKNSTIKGITEEELKELRINLENNTYIK